MIDRSHLLALMINSMSMEELVEFNDRASERIAALKDVSFETAPAYQSLDVSQRTRSALRWLADGNARPAYGKVPITAREIAEYGEARLLLLPNMGRKSIAELRNSLSYHNIVMAP